MTGDAERCKRNKAFDRSICFFASCRHSRATAICRVTTTSTAYLASNQGGRATRFFLCMSYKHVRIWHNENKPSSNHCLYTARRGTYSLPTHIHAVVQCRMRHLGRVDNPQPPLPRRMHWSISWKRASYDSYVAMAKPTRPHQPYYVRQRHDGKEMSGPKRLAWIA